MIDFIFEVLDNLLVLLPWSMRKRDRRREWTGTVESKKTWTLSKHAYLVIFRTDDGKMKRVRMDRKEDFDIYQEGRRYVKKAGQVLPDTKPTA
jgi:hypothetical protein